MNGLMLHTGADTVTRDDIFAADTPANTATHYPIPHSALYNRVNDMITSKGLSVVQEAHGLTKGGDRWFGMFEVKGGDGCDAFGTVIGVRNSHDKKFSAGLAMGSRTFVCDNLAFSGDIKIGRKHTRYIMDDLSRFVADAFGKLGKMRQSQHERYLNYMQSELTDMQAHDLMIRGIDARAIAPSKMKHLIKEWREPSHDEFKPRTVWSLFNAFTEVYKQTSLTQLHQNSNRLHGLLDRHVIKPVMVTPPRIVAQPDDAVDHMIKTIVERSQSQVVDGTVLN